MATWYFIAFIYLGYIHETACKVVKTSLICTKESSFLYIFTVRFILFLNDKPLLADRKVEV